jgi:cell division protein FtsN
MSTLPSRSTFAADAPSALANTTPENKPVHTEATHAPTPHTPPSYTPDGGKIRNLAEKAPSSANADNEKPQAPALQPRPEPAYLPSRDSHQSTQWAQVGYFGNEFAAQEFWEALATDHPEITSVLRLRISQPFQMREKGGVTARIGPITSADQREKICDLARYRRLQCAKFSDKGSATNSIMERGRASEPASETNENASAIGFWVQLGSYGDTAQAEQQWRQLVSAHPDILKKQSYDISAPHYSSSSTRVLRLRAGPFSAQDQAMELCSVLQKRGVRCLTLRN